MFFRQKKIKIGLALGSGGPRGLAHIGILKALEKHNIKIDYIAGSSAGSIAGGFYAATKDAAMLEKITLEAGRRELLSLFFDPSIKQGFVVGNKLEVFIEKYIGKIKFPDLKIPFVAVATDLITKKPVVIKRGKVSKALRISSSIPVMFKPVKKGEHILIDGGLSAPVPVDIVKKMGADFVIAVNLDDYTIDSMNTRFGFYKIINNTISIFAFNLSRNNIRHADLAISAKTADVDWRTILFKEQRKKVIEDNQKLMVEKIPKLKELINEKGKSDFAKFFSRF